MSEADLGWRMIKRQNCLLEERGKLKLSLSVAPTSGYRSTAICEVETIEPGPGRTAQTMTPGQSYQNKRRASRNLPLSDAAALTAHPTQARRKQSKCILQLQWPPEYRHRRRRQHQQQLRRRLAILKHARYLKKGMSSRKKKGSKQTARRRNRVHSCSKRASMRASWRKALTADNCSRHVCSFGAPVSGQKNGQEIAFFLGCSSALEQKEFKIRLCQAATSSVEALLKNLKFMLLRHASSIQALLTWRVTHLSTLRTLNAI